MATKNLSRTVIEGGRTRGSKWHRRWTNGQQRTNARRVSDALVKGAGDAMTVYPARICAYPQFNDKLRPTKRWLGAHIGQPWDKVRSELFARFDIRTTPGRHILFDHLLPEVERQSVHRFHRPEYVVDRSGLLRKAKRK